MNNSKKLRDKRRARIRAVVSGTKSRPRMSVFRSNKNVFVQLIDDAKGVTLVSYSTKNVKESKGKTKSDVSFMVGEELANLAKEQKIKTVVFDRGGYRYHGRVKQIAEGARKGGLEF